MVQVNKAEDNNGEGTFQEWAHHGPIYHTENSHLFIGAAAGVIILVYGIIRVRRAGLNLASRETVYTAPVPSSYFHTSRSIFDFFMKWFNALLNYSWCTPIERCCTKIPVRIRHFYINAFLIPKFRKEWGKYRRWTFRSPLRHRKKSFHVHYHAPPEEVATAAQSEKNVLLEEDNPLPVPVAHNHAGCRRIRINVGGCVYETQARTLNRFPETLLGDPNKRLRYFDPVNQEYFFDRNRSSFETILYYYQSGGRFKRPDSVSADILLDDANFYCLPESVIYQYLCEEGLSLISESEDILPRNLFMRKIWLLFDFPGSSMQAQIVSLISVLAITLSITTFCIETLSSLSLRYRYFMDSADGQIHGISPNFVMNLNDPFYFTETICSCWFLVEYLIRLASSPLKKDFLISTLNIIDLIAVLPYFVQAALPSDSGSKSDDMRDSVYKNTRQTGPVSVIRVVRLVRVFRIFKLSRHSRGLKILGKTLQASFTELIMLIFFVMIGVILFSSTMYFAELGTEGTPFTSIPDGFWWALITITTVGYGDNVPKSNAGKIVGALCAIAGVLTLALPVPVIVSNFNFFYHQALGEADLSWIKISHTSPCPFRPTNYPADYNDSSQHQLNADKDRKHQKRGKKTANVPNDLATISSSEDEFDVLKIENKDRVMSKLPKHKRKGKAPSPNQQETNGDSIRDSLNINKDTSEN